MDNDTLILPFVIRGFHRQLPGRAGVAAAAPAPGPDSLTSDHFALSSVYVRRSARDRGTARGAPRTPGRSATVTQPPQPQRNRPEDVQQAADAHHRQREGTTQQGAEYGPDPDREVVRKGSHHAHGLRTGPSQDQEHLHGSDQPRRGDRRRRRAPGKDQRDLRPRVVGEDDALSPRDRERPARGGHRRLHRRRTRARHPVREEARHQRGRSPGRTAGHWRTGAGDRRGADPQQRGRRNRDRFGGGAGPPRGDRGRDGRLARRSAGPPHEPGAAEAHGRRQPVQRRRDLHQPDT